MNNFYFYFLRNQLGNLEKAKEIINKFEIYDNKNKEF